LPLPTHALAVQMLERAMRAGTPRARGLWARRGLALPSRIDRSTHSLLLRQLYLALYEESGFRKAAEVAEQAVRLAVLPEVAHHDAARALQALGEIDAAAGHLRLAARVGSVERRPFHWWTLGSVLFLARRYEEAISVMARAARWGTTDKPLYQGHLAVVRCASGQRVPELPALIDRLAEAPSGQGYGHFVLGLMAFHAGRHDEARRYLTEFLRAREGGRVAVTLSLAGEIALARETLAAIGNG
jgi:tetratricopeptide (TPR) repeat protein